MTDEGNESVKGMMARLQVQAKVIRALDEAGLLPEPFQDQNWNEEVTEVHWLRPLRTNDSATDRPFWLVHDADLEAAAGTFIEMLAPDWRAAISVSVNPDGSGLQIHAYELPERVKALVIQFISVSLDDPSAPLQLLAEIELPRTVAMMGLFVSAHELDFDIATRWGIMLAAMY